MISTRKATTSLPQQSLHQIMILHIYINIHIHTHICIYIVTFTSLQKKAIFQIPQRILWAPMWLLRPTSLLQAQLHIC